jgi:two-component system response regulator AgrA
MLLTHLQTLRPQGGLYILDVNLQHEENGIILATEIKKLDAFGKFIFISAYPQLMQSVFTYRIEALGYILKEPLEDVVEELRECIDVAYARLSA